MLQFFDVSRDLRLVTKDECGRFDSFKFLEAESGHDEFLASIEGSELSAALAAEVFYPSNPLPPGPRMYCGAIFRVRSVPRLRQVILPYRKPLAFFDRLLFNMIGKPKLSGGAILRGYEFQEVWCQDAILSPAHDQKKLIGVSLPCSGGGPPYSRILRDVTNTEPKEFAAIIFLRLSELLCPVACFYRAEQDMANVFPDAAGMLAGYLGIADTGLTVRRIRDDFFDNLENLTNVLGRQLHAVQPVTS